MTVQEILDFISLLSQLDKETQKELLYMIKGAALVADRAN